MARASQSASSGFRVEHARIQPEMRRPLLCPRQLVFALPDVHGEGNHGGLGVLFPEEDRADHGIEATGKAQRGAGERRRGVGSELRQRGRQQRRLAGAKHRVWFWRWFWRLLRFSRIHRYLPLTAAAHGFRPALDKQKTPSPTAGPLPGGTRARLRSRGTTLIAAPHYADAYDDAATSRLFRCVGATHHHLLAVLTVRLSSVGRSGARSPRAHPAEVSTLPGSLSAALRVLLPLIAGVLALSHGVYHSTPLPSTAANYVNLRFGICAW